MDWLQLADCSGYRPGRSLPSGTGETVSPARERSGSAGIAGRTDYSGGQCSVTSRKRLPNVGVTIMPLAQKWVLGLIALGAGYLVFTNPNGFYKFATGTRQLVAGSIVDVTTGGKGKA